MQKRSSLHKLFILPLLLAFSLSAGEQISLSFSLQPDEADHYFKLHKHRARIVTDSKKLEMAGTCENTETPFVLLSVNNKSFPIYPEKGSFNKLIPIQEGKNRITVETPDGYSGKTKFDLIRISPAIINSVEFLQHGAESIFNKINDSNLMETWEVTTPEVIIRGKKPSHDFSELSVKDHFGNPVMIDQKEGVFSVKYTLREGQNDLYFRSNVDGDTFQKKKISFHLKDVVRLYPDEDHEMKIFWKKTSISHRYDCQSESIHLAGKVDAIANGTITLDINGALSNANVTNHIFRSEVKLTPNSVNSIKASVKIGDQTYFDYIEVSHFVPSATITELTESVLDGTVLEKRFEVKKSGDVFKTRNVALNISSELRFMGNLDAEIFNLSTKEATPIANKAGTHETSVFLKEGINELLIRLGKGSGRITFDPVKIKLLSPIIVGQINKNTIVGDKVTLPDQELTLAGFVNSISRGFMSVILNGKEVSEIPIIRGRFETADPINLKSGENKLILQIKIKGHTYQKELLITTPQNTEEVDMASLETVSDDSIQGEQKGDFSQPIPIKTNPPEEVFDPVTKKKISGSVTLKFTINKKGNVDPDNISILQSSNELLEPVAKKAVGEWSFEPAVKDGNPINLTTKITLNWN